jgi:hypothetical protein
MMRKVRELELAARAPRAASAVRAGTRTFPLFFAFAKDRDRIRVACHLLGPKRTLPPQYDKFGASFCTARECDRIELPKQYSEENS